MDCPALTLDDAFDVASTGEIRLFRGRSAADRVIRALTNSPVNRVGLVVAIDDPPSLLWHAELGRSPPDVWAGGRQRGVQLHHLREAVTTWNARYNQRAGSASSRAQSNAIMRTDDGEHRPFRRSSVFTNPGLIMHWAKGRVRRATSMETISLPRAGRHDLPAHGPAPERSTAELV